MEFLWRQPAARTPAAVRQGLGLDVAYTTVQTILVRLWKKGRLAREPAGRAYAYRPTTSATAYAVDRMQAALSSSSERAGALMHFVDSLSPEEVGILRQFLDEERP